MVGHEQGVKGGSFGAVLVLKRASYACEAEDWETYCAQVGSKRASVRHYVCERKV